MTTSQPANGPKPADGGNAAILRRLELVWGTVAAEPEGELGKGAWEFEDLLRTGIPISLTLAAEALELREEVGRLRRSVAILPGLDCRYTTAGVADFSGIHCPHDRPFQRCELEQENARLAHPPRPQFGPPLMGRRGADT